MPGTTCVFPLFWALWPGQSAEILSLCIFRGRDRPGLHYDVWFSAPPGAGNLSKVHENPVCLGRRGPPPGRRRTGVVFFRGGWARAGRLEFVQGSSGPKQERPGLWVWPPEGKSLNEGISCANRILNSLCSHNKSRQRRWQLFKFPYTNTKVFRITQYIFWVYALRCVERMVLIGTHTRNVPCAHVVTSAVGCVDVDKVMRREKHGDRHVFAWCRAEAQRRVGNGNRVGFMSRHGTPGIRRGVCGTVGPPSLNTCVLSWAVGLV